MKFEQPQENKNEDERYRKAKARLLEIFSTKNQEEIRKLYSEIRSFAGVIGLNAESIIAEIQKDLDQESPEESAEHSFGILKEILDQRIDHPEIFENAHRERIIQESGNIRLSELMYYNIDLENGTAIIHIAPKGDLGIGGIIKSFRDGMKELAKQVKEDERIKNIATISWIVASNPGLLEQAGFKVEGLIDEEMKAKRFKDESRPVSWAHMSRETLLERYLK